MVKFDLNLFLKSLSFALDFVEIDILGATVNHSRRVAYIALRIANVLQLSDAEKSDLVMYSVMHDNGLAEEVIVTSMKLREMKRIERMEGLQAHCDFGQKNIIFYPRRSNAIDIVKYHHENFNGSGFFGLKGDEIPLLAQIVAFGDFLDNFYHFKNERKVLITEYVTKQRGERFSPLISDIFLTLSQEVKFWLDLNDEFIFTAISELIPANIMEVSWDEIFEITKVFSSVVDSKSRFTGRHTTGLIEKAEIAADFYQFSKDKKTQFKIAASLHDIGKLAISRDILEKPGPMSYEEREQMKTHTYYTKMALKQIPLFSEIKEWAANHHERLDGKGYPERLSADKIDFPARLMACLDIYQALSEDRPYRLGMTFEQSFQIMEKMALDNAIDNAIVHEFIPQFKPLQL
jgi:HD-GYP domain-containing protein (c-di-GMP phosphodiesterase class II)